ncbi:MAG: radical SAM protein, partial [Syntrophales bacterium]|nr:radical SAM protein [Syntrophales bacterium]
TVTGGEPALQQDLQIFIEEIKRVGYLIKLDTNGSFPQITKNLIDAGDVDFVAMDIKAPLDKYTAVTCSKVETSKIRESIDIIISSGIEYEFRTTIVPALLNREDLLAIADEIHGARNYVLQRFVPSKTLDTGFMLEKPCSLAEMNELREALEHYLSHVTIRS